MKEYIHKPCLSEKKTVLSCPYAQDNKAAKDIVQGHLDNNKKSDIQEAVKNAVNTAVPSANIKNSDVSSFDVTFQSSAAALRLGLGVVGGPTTQTKRKSKQNSNPASCLPPWDI
eukprot:813439-Pelagomonas_calceolata.AAC.1